MLRFFTVSRLALNPNLIFELGYSKELESFTLTGKPLKSNPRQQGFR
jgi:hypothetical protein